MMAEDYFGGGLGYLLGDTGLTEGMVLPSFGTV
jgi:hypothetical protein